MSIKSKAVALTKIISYAQRKDHLASAAREAGRATAALEVYDAADVGTVGNWLDVPISGPIREAFLDGHEYERHLMAKEGR